MARRLDTYEIPFNLGGLNHSSNIDKIPPEAMVHPSRNLNLNEDGRGNRGGTAKMLTGYGGAQIMGQFDFILQDGSQFLVVATADGKVWKNITATIKTGLTANKKTRFEVLNNVLYMFNSADVPQVWDGSAGSTSDLSNIPTDWTGTSFPAWAVKHGRGLSERLWAGGCPDNPNTIYASKLNDGVTEADFSNAEVHITYVETGNDGGLSGAVEFGDRLIMFSTRTTFLYDDSDTNTDNWGYSKAQFEYGIANFDLIVRTPNDLIGMMEDGTVYSVSTVESYGDYQAASLTKPAHIDRWIQEYINLAKIAQFHAIYDPKLRGIKFFMVYKGQTQITMALVYFIDRGPMDGWIPHDNQSSTSGYTASASCLYKEGVGNHKVLTGDYNGNVWEIETENKNDDSNGFYAGLKLARLTFNNARTTKKYMRAFLLCHAKGDHDIFINIWTYNGAISSLAGNTSINLDAGQAVWGSVNWGDFLWGSAEEIIDKVFGIGRVAKRVQFEFYNSNVNESFFLSTLQIDFKTTGSRAS